MVFNNVIMDGFLAYYWNIIFLGTLFSFGLRSPYALKRLVWEFLGSIYLLYRLLAMYQSSPHLFSLSEGFRTCPSDPEPKKLIAMHTAWYMYSHNYQMYLREPAYTREMVMYHIGTIWLLVLCDYFHFVTEGLAVLLVMSASTPLLVAAKVLRARNNPIQQPVFIAFVSLFFFSMITAFPLWVLKHTLQTPLRFLTVPSECFLYALFNLLLLSFYSLQIHWLHKAIGVLISPQM